MAANPTASFPARKPAPQPTLDELLDGMLGPPAPGELHARAQWDREVAEARKSAPLLPGAAVVVIDPDNHSAYQRSGKLLGIDADGVAAVECPCDRIDRHGTPISLPPKVLHYDLACLVPATEFWPVFNAASAAKRRAQLAKAYPHDFGADLSDFAVACAIQDAATAPEAVESPTVEDLHGDAAVPMCLGGMDEHSGAMAEEADRPISAAPLPVPIKRQRPAPLPARGKANRAAAPSKVANFGLRNLTLR